MSKASVTVKATWIGFAAIIVAAIIGAVVTLTNRPSATQPIAVAQPTAGSVAVVGKSRDVSITYNVLANADTNRLQMVEATVAGATSQLAMNAEQMLAIQAALKTIEKRTRLQSLKSEAFQIPDGNRAFAARKTDGAYYVYFVLENVPVAQSIQMQMGGLPFKPGTVMNINNVVLSCISTPDITYLSFKPYSATYIPDEESTNLSRVQITEDRRILIDGFDYTPNAKHADVPRR